MNVRYPESVSRVRVIGSRQSTSSSGEHVREVEALLPGKLFSDGDPRLAIFSLEQSRVDEIDRLVQIIRDTGHRGKIATRLAFDPRTTVRMARLAWSDEAQTREIHGDWLPLSSPHVGFDEVSGSHLFVTMEVVGAESRFVTRLPLDAFGLSAAEHRQVKDIRPRAQVGSEQGRQALYEHVATRVARHSDLREAAFVHDFNHDLRAKNYERCKELLLSDATFSSMSIVFDDFSEDFRSPITALAHHAANLEPQHVAAATPHILELARLAKERGYLNVAGGLSTLAAVADPLLFRGLITVSFEKLRPGADQFAKSLIWNSRSAQGGAERLACLQELGVEPEHEWWRAAVCASHGQSTDHSRALLEHVAKSLLNQPAISSAEELLLHAISEKSVAAAEVVLDLAPIEPSRFIREAAEQGMPRLEARLRAMHMESCLSKAAALKSEEAHSQRPVLTRVSPV